MPQRRIFSKSSIHSNLPLKLVDLRASCFIAKEKQDGQILKDPTVLRVTSAPGGAAMIKAY